MAKLYGSQFPSRSAFLCSEEITTEYGEAIALYERTRRKSLEWQQELLSHIMAQNEDKLWTHTKFGYSIPRRNGKSEILIMRILYGLEHGERILYTAHRTTTSHSFFERVDKCLADMGYIKASEARREDDVPEEKLYDSYKANGLESLMLRKTGARVNFRTRTAKGGLGEGYDLLIIDEAQEYQDDQESSLKYVVTDSANPQTILCGTPPTAISSGTVFEKFRDGCLAGDVRHAGWEEWSVDVMTDPKREDAWVQTNPSLGHILTQRSIEDEIGGDDTDFNIQRLGLWLKYNQKSVISEALWNSLKTDYKPELKGRLYVGVKFGKDGMNIALSVAVKTTEDKVYVESLFCRKTSQGIGWITDFLEKADYEVCYSDGKSGEKLLADAAKEKKLRHIKFPKVEDVISANAMFEQALYDKSICHNGQAMLSEVVTNCKKRNIGSKGGFGYDVIIDEMEIAVMESMIFAFWSCKSAKEHKPQKITY